MKPIEIRDGYMDGQFSQIQKKKNQQIAENSEFSDIALIENYSDNEINNDSKTINKNIAKENTKENKSLANK